MSDPATRHPPLDAHSAWLAAYALGLAYSASADRQRLEDLVAATRNQPELIDAARRRLRDAEVAEPTICAEALRLLDQAFVVAAEGTAHESPS